MLAVFRITVGDKELDLAVVWVCLHIYIKTKGAHKVAQLHDLLCGRALRLGAHIFRPEMRLGGSDLVCGVCVEKVEHLNLVRVS